MEFVPYNVILSGVLCNGYQYVRNGWRGHVSERSEREPPEMEADRLEPPRDAIKVRSDGRAEQRKRREDVLARQKARRASALAQSRGLVEEGSASAAAASCADASFTDASMATTEPPSAAGSSSVPTTDAMEADAPPRPSPRRGAADALMSAEWMVDVPVDLADCWFVAARPAGRRCLVVATGGITKAHGRHGKPRSFPSALPNGSRSTRAGLCTCELDCIYRESEQTYYVLDVLNWKGQRMTDCPTDFRLYWLTTKLAETRASQLSSNNPCRFVPLSYAPCTPEHLQRAYAGATGGGGGGGEQAPELPSHDAAMDLSEGSAAASSAESSSAAGSRDGLLLLHREALYEAGPSPLLLSWSDASCSGRFYDYGSTAMAGAITADPSKADKWRTHELDAAVSFAEVLHAVQQPQMALS